MGRRQRIAFIATATLFVACCIEAVWAAPFIPATDMPAHLYGATARTHMDEPARDYARFLIANSPVTANGLINIYAFFEPVLGWRDAFRLITMLLVLAWVLGAGAFIGALERARAWLGLLAASTAFGWSFYAGFFAFCSGTALGFAFLALVLRTTTPTTPITGKVRALYALALLLVSTAHFLAAFLTGIVWLAIAVARAPRVPQDTRVREALWTCACAVPAALVFVVAATTAAGIPFSEVEVLPFSLRLAAWGEATIGGPLLRQLPLLIAMLTALALVALRWRTRTVTDRTLAIVAALFLVVPLVVPWSVFGWQHFAPRTLPLGALLLCAIVPLERAPTVLRTAVSVACVLAAFASTFWARTLHVRASADIADVLAALERPVPTPAGYRWPFVLVQPSFVDDASLFRWDPLRGVGNLFSLVQGGFPAYAFVMLPSSDYVLLRPEMERSLPPPLTRSVFVTPIRRAQGEARRARIDVLASHAVRVDGVILLEEPSDHAQWRERGYIVDVEEGRVLLARFAGCSLDVKGAYADIQTRIAPIQPAALARTDAIRGDARMEALPCGLIEVEGCGEKRTVQLQRGAVAELLCSNDDAAPSATVP